MHPKKSDKPESQITRAYKLAFRIGIDPQTFWKLTPWQFYKAFEAYNEQREYDHDQQVWIMYHGALLQRAKKMPNMNVFMSKSKNKKGVESLSGDDIMARLRLYQKNYEKKNAKK